MVNLHKLSSFLAFDWKPITHHPSTPVALSPSTFFGGSGHLQRRLPIKHHKLNQVLEPANITARADGCSAEPYNPPPISDQNFPPYDQTRATVYRYRQQQAVNLGSWFVHEKWMTPSLFACAGGSQGGEIDIANGWGSQDGARAVLERHWDTFIQASDFAYLSSIGINTVRLPIGFWCLGGTAGGGDVLLQGTPFDHVAGVYKNCWPRIVRAINQAAAVNIGVLVDLHGAPGSQNGRDHSGVSDGQTKLFSTPLYMDKAIAGLTFMMKTLARVSNVVGIQILNEPVYDDGLEDFYTRAMASMRAAGPGAESMPLYLHDGFDLDRFSKFVSPRKDFVVQDHHSYFVFTPSDHQQSASQHTGNVQGGVSTSLNTVADQLRRNLIVGEWSCSLTSESLNNEKDPNQAQRTFCEAQMNVYSNTTAGWAFWAYNKEECDGDNGWCFKSAVGKSLPSTFFSYGKPASTRLSKKPSNGSKNTTELFLPTLSQNHRRSNPHRASIGWIFKRQKASRKAAQTPKKRSSPHRFESVRQCRLQRRVGSHTPVTPSSPGSPSNTGTPSQRAHSSGYTDGSTTAKVFASHNMSRLGFVGQYIQDAVEANAAYSAIAASTKQDYQDGFMQGLREVEKAIVAGQ